MSKKVIFKILIDFIMIIILIALMGYPITDEPIHEWLGMSMLFIFIIHNILNLRWYMNLFKGKYSAFRIYQTLLNILMICVISCLMASGMMISTHITGENIIKGKVALGREMHIVTSYWGFVLMSVHFGLHWGMMINMGRKIAHIKEPSKIRGIMVRFIAALIAILGVRYFVKNNILSYMFMQNQFAFFDYEQSAVSFFFEYIMMMGTCVFVGYYFGLLMQRVGRKKE